MFQDVGLSQTTKGVGENHWGKRGEGVRSSVSEGGEETGVGKRELQQNWGQNTKGGGGEGKGGGKLPRGCGACLRNQERRV